MNRYFETCKPAKCIFHLEQCVVASYFHRVLVCCATHNVLLTYNMGNWIAVSPSEALVLSGDFFIKLINKILSSKLSASLLFFGQVSDLR